MKIWISFDMEGVAGIVDWDQCRPSGGARYEVGCQLMLDEVNAAIEGAIAGGATEIVLNDSHGTMANLDPRAIAGGASYISGRHKPRYMMQGLDDTFDAVFLVGYHGSISGRPSTLSHTYNPEVFAAARVNGELVGESGINALVAEHYGVPIAFVSGDAVTWEETEPFAPDAVHVVTKESITRFSAAQPAPGRVLPADPGGRRAGGARGSPRDGVADAGHRPPGHAGAGRSDRRHGRGGHLGPRRRAHRRADGARSPATTCWRCSPSFVAVTYITRQAGGR